MIINPEAAIGAAMKRATFDADAAFQPRDLAHSPSQLEVVEVDPGLLHQTPTTCIGIITPEVAQQLLDNWNTRNRPVSTAKVYEYAASMRAGRWMYTGEPIIFSQIRLLDGQNRLHACVKSGKPFTTMIVYGAPDEAFAFIDTGKARTASDIFSIHGVKNAALMAASMTLVVGYERYSVTAFIRNTLDHEALYEEYLKHTALQDSAWCGHLFNKAKLAPPSVMCAYHYLCAQKSRYAADHFFRQVADGVGLESNQCPEYKLRAVLLKNAQALQHVRLKSKSIAAITVKAWNAARLQRKKMGPLTYAVDEPFPRIR